MNTQEILKNASKIVIKIGTALIVNHDGTAVKQDWLDALAHDIHALKADGKDVIIVSSGAVALGRKSIGIPLDMPPSQIPLEKKQASSAAGQFHIFNGFHTAFEKHGLKHAQALLTMAETENRRSYLNARSTLEELLKANIIPIINENDVVSTEEIRFGDNDRLAARIGQMLDADLVILLSTTDGFYSANPELDNNATHFPIIENLCDEHFDMAGEAIPGMSTGGMKSKLQAAQASTSTGTPLIITDGRENSPIAALLSHKNKKNTLFKAKISNKNAKKRWIGEHMAPKGSVIIDYGAQSALKAGKSLLPVGVKACNGEFNRGDVIEVKNQEQSILAKGISAYNAHDIERFKGLSSQEIAELQGYIGRTELIHRNDMVLIDS